MEINEIIEFRHELHQNPELSNNEVVTSERISKFIEKFSPDREISIGPIGKAFIFNGSEPGKTLMFRAELDALPISEKSIALYASTNNNISHACGHDGHMSIVAGLANKISKERPVKGRVVLLFQPAEEIEQGAKDMVEHPEFKNIEPDLIFALHNIPGEQKNKVLLKEKTFAAASKGMTIKLFGKTSHAAEPENGISPAVSISKIITGFQKIVNDKQQFEDLALITVIYLKMGEISFGTSPGYAEIMATLRSYENSDMDRLTNLSEKLIEETSFSEGLTYEISYSEVFPAVINDFNCLKLVEDSAKNLDLKIEYLNKPFKWSEDFSYYSQKHPACFFGLGAGIDQPQLHNPEYDFPDDIIETGINIFFNIYKKINF